MKLALKLPAAESELMLERGVFSMTFDDFPRTAWTEGGAVLAAHRAHATYYVCGGLQGRFHDGGEQFKDGDVEAIHAAGHEIGSHTFDHLSALKSSPKEFAHSLERNDRFLRERTGVLPTSFAYPYGDVSLRCLRTVGRRFSSARGIIPGTNSCVVSRLRLRSVGLEFGRRRAVDFEPYIALASRRREWLICRSHDVSDRPSEFGCRPDDLYCLLKMARAAGLEVATVGQVMGRLKNEGPRTARARDTLVSQPH